MRKRNAQKMLKGIGQWRQSGLTQKAWCEKNHMAYATFHYWYKRYREEESVMVHRPKDGFVQLVMDSPKISPWCEMLVPDGRKLFFHGPVSAEFLRSLID